MRGEKTQQAVWDSTLKAICLFLMLSGICYFVFARINLVLLGSLLAVTGALLVDQTLILHNLVFYYTGIYALSGLYRIYVFAGGNRDITSMQLAFFMMAATVFLLRFQNRKQLLFFGRSGISAVEELEGVCGYWKGHWFWNVRLYDGVSEI